MATLPAQLLPLGFSSQILKNLPLTADMRVLPSVNDLAALSEAIESCVLRVGVIGPDWPRGDLTAARELLLDHAIACVVVTDFAPAVLEPAISAALGERERLVDSSLFGQFMQLHPDLIYFKDRLGRFIAANQAVARRFQVEDASQVVGRTDFDFLAAEYAQKTMNDEQGVMRTGLPILALLEKATYAEKEASWWLTWKAPLHDQTGRLIGTFGFSRNQSALKNTEIALETERHLLEVLLTGLPDSVYIKDREGRFLLANQVIANRLGVTQSFLRGKRDVDLYPPEVAAGFRKDEDAIMATGMPLINREEVIIGADGREMHILTTKLPYRNPEGEVIGIIGMGRNITLRKGFDEQMKLAQAEIVKLRAEVDPLRDEVARLTAALALARSG